MKKLVFLCVLCLVVTTSAFAQTSIHFGVGGKYWMASWNAFEDFYGFESIDDMHSYIYEGGSDAEGFDAETGNMFGPNVSIRSGKFGLSATYLMGKWEWPSVSWFSGMAPWYGIDVYQEGGSYYYDKYTILSSDEVVWYDDYGVSHLYDDYFIPFAAIEPSRKDLVLTASYQIIPNPNISIFAGMKNISYDYELNYTYEALRAEELGLNYTDISDNNTSESFEFSGTGFGGGLSASFPLGRSGAFIYGSGAYMKIGGDIDASNMTAEGGLGFKPRGVPVVGTVGYRYEGYEEEEKIQGLTVGINYFQ